MLNYESGLWSEVGDFAAKLNIPEALVPDVFLQAVGWARQVLYTAPVAEPK